jgi:hypothetical protein
LQSTSSASKSKSSAATSISLPRMNCATYHPNTGCVYASGTGVFSLSSPNVNAVLNEMASSHEVPRGFRKYTQSSRTRQSTNNPNENAPPSKSSICLIHNILLEKGNTNKSFHYFAKIMIKRRWTEGG